MSVATLCTIDASGRLVVPKSVRDRAGLLPGMTLEVDVDDGVVRIRPAPVRVTFEDRDGVIVATAEGDVPALEADIVQGTLDAVRARR